MESTEGAEATPEGIPMTADVAAEQTDPELAEQAAEAVATQLAEAAGAPVRAKTDREAAAALAQQGFDVFSYVGDLAREGYEKLSRACHAMPKRKKALLMLATYGGDPDAGFRVARCLRHHYSNLTVLVPTYCKSAGTLVCVAADEIVMGDEGELGPLDIQINKPDEIAEFSSGLDIMQSLNMLKDLVLQSFQEHMLDIRFKNNVSTKVASEVAAKLAIGVFSPIYGQVDPLRVGEIQRANQIVWHYAQRLNEYGSILLDKSSLSKLVYTYPSHGFVIDRREAKTCFRHVRAPDHNEQLIAATVPPGKVSARVPVLQVLTNSD